jgi:hypothetical protein
MPATSQLDRLISITAISVIRAFRTARMCRVSTQMTGKPASARAL